MSPAIGSAVRPCATVQVTVTPPVSAQDAPFEKIRSTLTSCAKSTETMTLTQHIIAPFVEIPYSCCGTYNVHDQGASSSGIVLPQTIPFTFA